MNQSGRGCGGCKPTIEVIMKMEKQKLGRGGGGGSQGGSEPRIEVIQRKIRGGGGVRVDVNQELK